MPEICYVPKRFNDEHMEVIEIARDICEDFSSQGYDLTLRQLYYQFVKGDQFPDSWTWKQTPAGKWVRDPSGTKNADPNYKKLGTIITDARLAGELDWKFLVDRHRKFEKPNLWENPAELMEAVADQFKVDKWSDQDERIEVWVEKDALSGIIERAVFPLDVPWIACKGYMSQSQMWQAAQRFKTYIKGDQSVRILHLGDHDPSGIDMTRDIEERLSLFMAQDIYNAPSGWLMEDYVGAMREMFQVDRIALNMDQIRRYNPPPNPAKLSDSRGADYVLNYGVSSWELDALDPATMVDLIRRNVIAHRDPKRWKTAEQQEREDGTVLRALHENWDEAREYVLTNLTDEETT